LPRFDARVGVQLNLPRSIQSNLKGADSCCAWIDSNQIILNFIQTVKGCRVMGATLLRDGGHRLFCSALKQGLRGAGRPARAIQVLAAKEGI